MRTAVARQEKRRALLKAGAALACAPAWAGAVGDQALQAATGPNWAHWQGATPALILPDLQGRLHTLTDWRGQVLIVSFWASWCEPCRAELPAMTALIERHRSDGLHMLAVNVGESPQKIATFLEKWPMPATVLHDRNSAALKPWQVLGMPGNFLLDRYGVLRYWHLGALDWEQPQVGAVVQNLLRE